MDYYSGQHVGTSDKSHLISWIFIIITLIHLPLKKEEYASQYSFFCILVQTLNSFWDLFVRDPQILSYHIKYYNTASLMSQHFYDLKTVAWSPADKTWPFCTFLWYWHLVTRLFLVGSGNWSRIPWWAYMFAEVEKIKAGSNWQFGSGKMWKADWCRKL